MKPAGWDLAYVEGGVDKGYAVLDDGIKSRLQLRWQKTGKEVDMTKAAERQSRLLAKKAGRGASETRVEDFKVRTLRGKKFRFDKGGASTIFYMLQCSDCMQIVLLGVFGDEGEDTEEIAAGIIESLRDHGRSGKILWAVFGFGFNAPVEFRLKKHQLRSGDLSFEFTDGGDSFFYHRSSMAGMQLKNKSLAGWTHEFMGIKHPRLEIENVFEDSALRAGGVLVRAREVGKVRMIKKRPADACFWVNENMNSILGVVELKGGEESRLKDLVRGVVSH